MNQYPREDERATKPTDRKCLTCVHWWPRSEGGGTCGKAFGTPNVTEADDWCREWQGRGLRGLPNRGESW